MKDDKCPHCGQLLPVIVDAYCPSCQEPLDTREEMIAALTSRQLKYLVVLKGYHSSPPTVGKMLVRALPAHLLLIGVYGGIAGVWALLGLTTLAYVALGVLAGLFLRDLGWYRATIRAWPIHDAVIDWSKVDQLLTEANS